MTGCGCGNCSPSVTVRQHACMLWLRRHCGSQLVCTISTYSTASALQLNCNAGCSSGSYSAVHARAELLVQCKMNTCVQPGGGVWLDCAWLGARVCWVDRACLLLCCHAVVSCLLLISTVDHADSVLHIDSALQIRGQLFGNGVLHTDSGTTHAMQAAGACHVHCTQRHALCSTHEPVHYHRSAVHTPEMP